MPENDGDYSKVIETKTASGDIFHIWQWKPVKYVRRWSSGKPYYTNLDDENSTWDRPKGFGSPPKKSKFHIIYSHGRREDVTLFSPRYRLQNLAWQLDAACYMYEWPGYAQSPGLPTERKVFESIEATYKYLVNEKEIDPLSIILYGMSLGSGPTCWLASKYPVGGVVIQSGFTSICRVVSSHCGCKGSCLCCLPGCSFCCDLFDNLKVVEKITCPTYILHSKEDEVIPFEHAEHMLKKLGSNVFQPPYIVEKSKHDFFPVYTKEYLERLKAFLDTVGKRMSGDYKIDVPPVAEVPAKTVVDSSIGSLIGSTEAREKAGKDE